MPPPLVIEFVDPTAGRKRAREEREGALEPRPGPARALAPASPQAIAKPPAPARPRFDDDDAVRRSVASLGVEGLALRDRKAWEAKRLRSLGALVPAHSARMPLKMAIGVMRARRDKEVRRAAHAKEAGLLAGGGTGGTGGLAAPGDKRRREEERKQRRHEDERDGITPDNVRGAVMFVGGAGRGAGSGSGSRGEGDSFGDRGRSGRGSGRGRGGRGRGGRGRGGRGR